jgi:proteasome lid subunit RPN8/RPN11
VKNLFRLLCILLLVVSSVAQSTVAPANVVKKLRMSAAFSMIGGSSMGRQAGENTEKSAAIEANGQVVYGSFSDQFGGTLTVPSDTVLFLHTHPHNGDPHPSQTDIDTAKQLGVPNCAVSLREIWCAMPDGRVEQMQ